MVLLFELSKVSFYGFALVALGLLIPFFIGKRRFSRRGIAGLQHFHNYWIGVFTLLLERIAVIISFLMVAAGGVLVIVEWCNNHS